MNQSVRNIFRIALFLLPLLIAIALINLGLNWNKSLVFIALVCFAWAVAYPYITIGLDGKLVDFIYYSLAIAGVVLLAQTQLQEKDLVDAEYELAEASSQLQLMNNVNQKFNQLINTNSADRLEQYIDDWTESPFVSMESSGLLELEYWFNQENVKNLTIEPTAMVAAMSKRMTKLTKDAEQEEAAAKQALIAAKAKQSTASSSNALFSRVIELNVWPYLMCLAFALKIARKRII